MKSLQLRALISTGLLILVAIMPFHAFLSVWAGHLLGHQAIWQSWKEVLLAILLASAAILIYREPRLLQRYRQPVWYAAAGFIVVGICVTLINRPAVSPILYGLKTDYEFIAAAALATLVADARFVRRLTAIIIGTAAVVIAFGLLQIYLLPKDWLIHFGYGVNTVQPYQLVDPAVNSVRILSTLGGPIQLGSYLLLPLALVYWRLIRRPRWWHLVYLVAGILVLWHTYSRAAYLGLGVALAVITLIRLPRIARLPALLAVTVCAAITLQVLLHYANSTSKLQYYVFHQNIGVSGPVSSSTEHSIASSQGLQAVIDHPFGKGLGTAGPASFHGAQAFIPEDYYLQLAYETSLVGLAAFVLFEVLATVKLWRNHRNWLAPGAVAAIAGVSTINLFLHGWADSSTALIAWTAIGASLEPRA